MSRYICQYVDICNFYLETKFIQYLPLRELYLLPILDTRWETININFIVELSESTRFNIVITVVDSISKKDYFISTHTTVTVKDTARFLFAQYLKNS